MNSDDFTVLASGGSRHHQVSMCYAAVAFKITELVVQRICIKFCIKLEHSSMETIQMIQKAAAMVSW